MKDDKNNDEPVVDLEPSQGHTLINLIVRGLATNDRLKDWVYTLCIFLIVTVILTLPFYFMMSAEALLLIPIMIFLGSLVALFTTYILTPFGLRHFREYGDDMQIRRYLDDLSNQAEIKTPKLLVTETPEINAMVFSSLFGGRLCLTRGLIDAYHHGAFSDDELKAILGHEIGHLKHGDCFKWAFVLSWMSIFDLIGTLMLILGGGCIAAGAVTTVLSDRENPGPLIMLMGVFMVIAGVAQRLICKVASIPALHLSRTHEFSADLMGARLTSADTCISALEKVEFYNLQMDPEKLAQLPFSDRWQEAPRNISWIDGLFKTHPSLERRISNLEQSYEVPSLVQKSSRHTIQKYPPRSTLSPFNGERPVPGTNVPVTRTDRIIQNDRDMDSESFPELDFEPIGTPGSHKEILLRNKKVITAGIILGIVIAGLILIVVFLV
jgi:Zn-dependent protease with chaperone function